MSCCKGEMGHKRIDISHMSHADNMGGHKRIHFLYMSHKSKWRGQPALVQLVPDTINFPIFCEPQNSDKPVGIRLSTTKDGFSSGS